MRSLSHYRLHGWVKWLRLLAGMLIIGATLGCRFGGCTGGVGPKNSTHTDQEITEPFNKSNYSDNSRDGYELQDWTDGSLFFPGDSVDVYIEVSCPRDMVPSKVRVDIDAPGISKRYSSFRNEFTISELEVRPDRAYRIKVIDCVRTGGTWKEPNVLLLGTHQMTVNVSVNEGPVLKANFPIKVKRRPPY